MPLVYFFLLFFFSHLSSAEIMQKNQRCFFNIESFAKQENYKTDYNPFEKKLTINNDKTQWIFVLGFQFFSKNKQNHSIKTPLFLENDKIFAPCDEILPYFEKESSKKYFIDTLNQQITFKKPPPSTTKIAPLKQERAGTREVKTIVIDPGHGGKDPGALGKKSKEKDIVLKVALLLQKKLKKEGFNVKLTRDKDVFVQLGERANLANQWDGDLFISLHCNAVDGVQRQRITEGYHFYVLRAPESEEDKAIARRENKVATLYGDGSAKAELSPIEWIKLEAQLEKYKQSSYDYTEELLKSFQGNGKIKQLGGGVGGAGFMVLVGALMPAVLVELGFITHPKDEAYMITAAGQNKLAEMIAKSVIEYKKKVHRYRKTLQH